MEKDKIFKIPKDEPYWCNAYLPAMKTFDMPNEMKDTKTSDDIKKKQSPPKWPDKTPDPCMTKNHFFDKVRDLKNAPKMTDEQVQEHLRRVVYDYHSKITAVKDAFVKDTIKDDKFTNSSSGYWNVRFMPITFTDINEEVKKALDKRGHFNLALFYADYLKLGLEQLLLDEAARANPMLNKFEDMYFSHISLRCTLRMSMAQLKLDEGYFDYGKDTTRDFRYRDIASRDVTDLRTLITLRSAYIFSCFLYNMLYRWRYNPK